MLDKYGKLCEYIRELNEENQIALKKARNEHDVYGSTYVDLLATEDIIYLLKTKMKEIDNENNA